jgi:hypothetical protein
MKALLLITLVVAALAVVRADVDEKDVIIGTTDNFKSEIAEGPVLVEFYAPWFVALFSVLVSKTDRTKNRILFGESLSRLTASSIAIICPISFVIHHPLLFLYSFVIAKLCKPATLP